ncbi:hypothetical protein NQZ68_000006 [Dissostichus eleginoides]|nr:hypothetical protein NQZ68_000006 [Dissostichus eleginoides]
MTSVLSGSRQGWVGGVGGARGRDGGRRKKKTTSTIINAGVAGSRTLTFNRRKPKQIFYKISKRPKSVSSVSQSRCGAPFLPDSGSSGPGRDRGAQGGVWLR